jgi:hypothetical protein
MAIHPPAFEALPAFCRNEQVIFRSRSTGAWRYSAWDLGENKIPVSDDQTADEYAAKQHVASARKFLSRLPVRRECVIFTIVPYTRTKTGAAKTITAALEMDLVLPKLEGLQTFDNSHLDFPSAERWSSAFFHAAGPRISRCLQSSAESRM